MNTEDIMDKVNQNFPSQRFCDERHKNLDKQYVAINRMFISLILMVLGLIASVLIKGVG